MIVADASALVDLLIGSDRARGIAEELTEHAPVVAPVLVDAEVAGQLRRYERRGELGEERAGRALAQLRGLIADPLPARPFLARAWELRHNLTVADAIYVAAAESLSAPLLTCDARLAKGATGISGVRTLLI